LHRLREAVVIARLLIALSACVFALSAAADNYARAPAGWHIFCDEHPAECEATGLVPRTVDLTPARQRELQHINSGINLSIGPMTDFDQYGDFERWAYPDTGYGDCEDFVLEKRKRLVQRGWPLSALLITVVYRQQTGGHAVLLVRTSRGDLVLDNITSAILPPEKTPYRFVKRQSEADPNAWVLLERSGLVAAVRR
jgi:predicted transglutaminase-like cysteine proteinase